MIKTVFKIKFDDLLTSLAISPLSSVAPSLKICGSTFYIDDLLLKF